MDVTMPQLGEAVDEGTITAWLKQVGDEVTAEEPLFEVSTDKVDTEVPAPASGRLESILVGEGEVAEVGAPLAVLRTAEETDAEQSTRKRTDDDNRPRVDGSEDASSAPTRTGSDPAETIRATRRAGFLLSPLVRKLLKEHGVDPEEVDPTGDGGRITRDDVLRIVAEHGKGATTVPRTADAVDDDDGVIAFSRIRRSIANHMVSSKATSPHAYTSIEVDFDAIQRLRQESQDEWRQREGFSLTYLPFVCRAASDALTQWPRLNATVRGEALVLRDDVNLGIAVDLHHEGLVVPVVPRTQDMRLRSLARSIRDLADRARSGELSPDDMAGTTFTITNMGPFGTHQTLPIINQPQVAILATDAIKARPVAVETSEGEHALVVRHTGYLSLAWDHRAVDGAYTGGFLAAVKEVLETNDWSAELL